MNGALGAVLVRENKIRAANLLFIFWDLLYSLGYLLVFGLGIGVLRFLVLTIATFVVAAWTLGREV